MPDIDQKTNMCILPIGIDGIHMRSVSKNNRFRCVVIAGRTVAVLPSNLMSILAPVKVDEANQVIDNSASFASAKPFTDVVIGYLTNMAGLS